MLCSGYIILELPQAEVLANNVLHVLFQYRGTAAMLFYRQNCSFLYSPLAVEE